MTEGARQKTKARCILNSPDFISESSVGICVKDRQRKILFQNSLCIKKCGNKMGGSCGGPCIQKYDKLCAEKKIKVEGFCHFPRVRCQNGIVDFVVVSDDEQFLTLLSPLEEKHQAKIECYKDRNLTKCETKVASLILEGLSNAQIAKRLFISKATLKTHINNINKKIPPEMGPRI